MLPNLKLVLDKIQCKTEKTSHDFNIMRILL